MYGFSLCFSSASIMFKTESLRYLRLSGDVLTNSARIADELNYINPYVAIALSEVE